MPFLWFLLPLLGAVAVVALWPRILEWVRAVVLPRLQQLSPRLAELARQALIALDGVVSSVRAAARRAWHQLRPYLLELIVRLVRVGEVVLKIVESYIRESSSRRVRHQREETVLEYDELPEHLREKVWFDREVVEIDAIEERDRELGLEL